MSQQQVLEKAAYSVRIWLEEIGCNKSELLARFPKGCCGHASEILAMWLKEIGLRNIKYEWGRRNESTHGWLVVKGVIADITSDQFQDGESKVYVGERRNFHNSFEETKISTPELYLGLTEVYEAMKSSLNGG